METRDQIGIHEQYLEQAMLQQDINALEDLLHPALLFVLHTGQTITKEDDLATYRAGHLRIEHLRSHEQRVQILGTTAVVTVLVELRGQYQGEPFEGNFRYLRVWQQQQLGRWQVIAGSGMQLTS